MVLYVVEDMYPTPGPYRPRPNYALRRAVAVTGLLLVVWLVWTVVGGALGGDGGGDDQEAATTDESGEDGDGTSSSTEPLPVLEAVPPCELLDEQTGYAQLQDWPRTLVDQRLSLPAEYVPDDIVSGGEANYGADVQIRSIMATDLNALRNGIINAGVPEVAIMVGYRSYADQQALFEGVEAEVGFEEAIKITERAGHSEHQLGTAIDYRPLGVTTVDESFGESATGKWLAENSWKYGFILSYPKGEEATTCHRYEPWHFRYVGVELANRIHATGLTLREYLWHWQTAGSEPTPAMAEVAATSTSAPSTTTADDPTMSTAPLDTGTTETPLGTTDDTVDTIVDVETDE